MTLPLPEAGGDTPLIGERARVADNLGPKGSGRVYSGWSRTMAR
jgi:hypothetical protein